MTENHPAVSFIVPVYNTEQYLEECVNSILQQTVRNIEVILVDDGSTDSSYEICRRFELLDSRVVVFHTESRGVCSARNIGLDNARGEFLTFCDSDDCIDQKLAETALRYIDEYGLDCFVYGYKSFITPDSWPDPSDGSDMPIEFMDNNMALQTVLIGQKFRSIVWNKLYKKELWNGIRFPVGRKMGDDSSVTYKVMDKITGLGYADIPLYYYRQRAESVMHSPITSTYLQLFDAYDEIVEYIKEHHPEMKALSYEAYIIRLFDFFSRAKSEGADYGLYESVKTYARKHNSSFRKYKCGTFKQRTLLNIFLTSPKIFLHLYS